MDVQTVQSTIEQVLNEDGITDSFVEVVESNEFGVTFFDIQRRDVNGEELWFCFRIALSSDGEQFVIIRRIDFVHHRTMPDWSVLTSSKIALRDWLKQRFENDKHLLNELTRP